MSEASRLKLQNEFETLMENDHVYYQAPESVKMDYPAIRYKKKKINVRKASNQIYFTTDVYEVTVIDSKADNPVIKKILELPHSSYDRHYVSNNLHHDVLTIEY